jgi:hypothetical protein
VAASIFQLPCVFNFFLFLTKKGKKTLLADVCSLSLLINTTEKEPIHKQQLTTNRKLKQNNTSKALLQEQQDPRNKKQTKLGANKIKQIMNRPSNRNSIPLALGEDDDHDENGFQQYFNDSIDFQRLNLDPQYQSQEELLERSNDIQFESSHPDLTGSSTSLLDRFLDDWMVLDNQEEGEEGGVPSSGVVVRATPATTTEPSRISPPRSQQRYHHHHHPDRTLSGLLTGGGGGAASTSTAAAVPSRRRTAVSTASSKTSPLLFMHHFDQPPPPPPSSTGGKR